MFWLSSRLQVMVGGGVPSALHIRVALWFSRTLTVDGVPVDSNLPCVDVQTVVQCPTLPPAVQGLKATKKVQDVNLAWSTTPQAASYNGYRVLSDTAMTNRALIPQANATGAAGNPNIQAIASCTGVPGLACADGNAVAAAQTLLYYQQVAVCANGAEGPN